MDRFREIEDRLAALLEQESQLRDEKKILQQEWVELQASARGFRIGGLIEWTDKGVLQQGRISAIWEGTNGSAFSLGVKMDDGSCVNVGNSKKPRPLSQ